MAPAPAQKEAIMSGQASKVLRGPYKDGAQIAIRVTQTDILPSATHLPIVQASPSGCPDGMWRCGGYGGCINENHECPGGSDKEPS